MYDIAKLAVGPKAPSGVVNACNKLNARVPLDTFWLLVSGSKFEDAYRAYALFWLFVCNSAAYRCTLEAASAEDRTSCSILCGVNGSNDGQEVEDVARRLNCLYLTKGSMVAILEDGPDFILGITVH